MSDEDVSDHEEIPQAEQEEEEDDPLANTNVEDSDEDSDGQHERSESIVMHDHPTDEPSDDDTQSQGTQKSLASKHIERRRKSLTEEKELIAEQLSRVVGEAQPREQTEEETALIMSALNAYDEMEEIGRDKELFNEKFELIDPTDNGDVDVSEWKEGLKRLGVELKDSDSMKLFELMDHDKSDYIDRNDWISFCMTTYGNRELQQLQASILNRIKGHHRKPSNLVKSTEVDDWEQGAVTELEQEMKEEIKRQASNLQAAMEEEEQFYVEIERMVSTNPEFGQSENGHKWSPHEVAWWLDTLDLGQYGRKFVEDCVDGGILLNDMHAAILANDMGVKPLHLGKILRGIDELRQANEEHLNAPYKDWVQLDEENKAFQTQLTAAQEKILELEADNTRLRLDLINGPMQNPDNPSGALIGDAGATTRPGDDDDPTATGAMESKDEEQQQKDEEWSATGDKDFEIALLRSEVERLQDEKIQLAIGTGKEIQYLRHAIKKLSAFEVENKASYFSFVNPIDAFVGAMGYKKA